jgi:hypothetical protein
MVAVVVYKPSVDLVGNVSAAKTQAIQITTADAFDLSWRIVNDAFDPVLRVSAAQGVIRAGQSGKFDVSVDPGGVGTNALPFVLDDPLPLGNRTDGDLVRTRLRMSGSSGGMMIEINDVDERCL